MSRRGPRPPSQRQLRVGEAMRHALAEILERGEVHDPGLDGAPVTVTEVRIGPDLRNAIVFVMPLGGDGIADVVAGLGRARPFLRRRLAATLGLKYVPDIRFEADPAFDRAARIGSLLDDPRVAGDLGGAPDGEDQDHGT